MTVRESKPLIDFLYDHATQSQSGADCIGTGSLALWDNCVSLHHAVADYFGEMSKHRRGATTTIEGESPIAA